MSYLTEAMIVLGISVAGGEKRNTIATLVPEMRGVVLSPARAAICINL